MYNFEYFAELESYEARREYEEWLDEQEENYIMMMQQQEVMNEYHIRSLYDVLEELATDKLQCYLLACQENKYDDEVRVAANILRLRFINGE